MWAEHNTHKVFSYNYHSLFNVLKVSRKKKSDDHFFAHIDEGGKKSSAWFLEGAKLKRLEQTNTATS